MSPLIFNAVLGDAHFRINRIVDLIESYNVVLPTEAYDQLTELKNLLIDTRIAHSNNHH